MANVGELDRVRRFLRENADLHMQRTHACGTAGCVAGWTVALAAGCQPGQNLHRFVHPGDDIGEGADERAARILGLTYDESKALFYGTVGDDDEEGEALGLLDAIINREKGELTGAERDILNRYRLPTEPTAP